MIQRLQSIYLLGIAIIACVLLLADIPFYQESGKVDAEHASTTITIDYNSTDTSSEQVGRNDGLIYFLGATALLSLAALFLFKNRKLQLRLVMGICVMIIVVFVGMYTYSLGKAYTSIDTQTQFLSGAVIPLSMVILALLAYRGIRRDERLVRSLDRIR
ncbi:MAG: DUF4293 domain-containing protein [Bacteroidia bacterium]|nr:DUF4293 domain-containing protein [Bacteroidia bacterium]